MSATVCVGCKSLLPDQKLEFYKLVVLRRFLIADILCTSLAGASKFLK
jgi:hypothetical protein